MVANHRVANQMTRRLVKNVTTENVQIVLVNMKMCVKLRSKMFSSCIGWNELILGNLTSVDRWCNILTNKREITSDAKGVPALTTSGGFGQ